MPVAHLGLTVSQIRISTSFYLVALQPLGYNYIGSRGDSIGLGVDEADFFLTQEPSGSVDAATQLDPANRNSYRLAPTHIAFTARSRATVRDCYAAALSAGARPSGTPSYRQDGCTCFNAAVEDPDGNTVEFIWRDSEFDDTAPEYRRARTSDNYGRPVTTRSQTIQAMNQSIPRAGIQRSRTEPVESLPSKSVFGAMLGAAAGAVVGLAMLNTGRDSAREEARYSARSRARARSDDSRDRAAKRSASVTEGKASSRKNMYPPTDLVLRHIEAQPYRDDENMSYARQKLTQQSQGQSRTIEAIEYGPSRFSTRRSATMPIEKRNDSTTVYGRRSSVPHTSSKRRDSVVSGATTKTYQTGVERARSSTSESLAARPSKRNAASLASTTAIRSPPSLVSKVPTYMAAQVPLPPSLVSKSDASTAKPSRRSTFDAYYLPMDNDDDSDGLGETATIVPDDSISCINISSRKHERSSSRRRTSKAERGGSVLTIPIRTGRDEYTRTRNTYSNA